MAAYHGLGGTEINYSHTSMGCKTHGICSALLHGSWLLVCNRCWARAAQSGSHLGTHRFIPGSGSVVIVVMFPGLKRTVQVIFGITLGGGYK